jgi:hypothetical protein
MKLDNIKSMTDQSINQSTQFSRTCTKARGRDQKHHEQPPDEPDLVSSLAEQRANQPTEKAQNHLLHVEWEN